MSILRRVIRCNRDASEWIARRLPETFASPDPGYRATMLQRIADDIETHRPGIILEAGGVDPHCWRRHRNKSFGGLTLMSGLNVRGCMIGSLSSQLKTRYL